MLINAVEKRRVFIKAGRHLKPLQMLWRMHDPDHLLVRQRRQAPLPVQMRRPQPRHRRRYANRFFVFGGGSIVRALRIVKNDHDEGRCAAKAGAGKPAERSFAFGKCSMLF